jgi:Holliday junction resolvase RusA-like endonuclease
MSLIWDNIYLDLTKYSKKELEKINLLIEDIEKNNTFKEIYFCYDGEPKAAPRPRTTTVGKFTKWYDPGSKDKQKIRKYIKGILDENWDPIDYETHLKIKTYKPILKSFNKTEIFLAEAGILRPDKKPDVDNYAKTVMDAINGLVWTDDAKITHLEIDKFYSSYPRIEVFIKYRSKKIFEKLKKVK